ncbi:MAG: class II aldolase/adducin family protein [Candidatus Bathyarchaeia archaeon]
MNIENKLRKHLAKAGRILAEEGLVTGPEGNISARANKDLILIKPSGFSMRSITPKDFLIVNLDGKLIQGKHKPSIETPMHTLIYKGFKDVYAIMHTHAPFTNCLGIMGIKLIPISIEGLVAISKEVPILPFYEPGSQELANSVVEALKGGRDAVVLKNHGLVTVGKSIKKALNLSLIIEASAKLQFLCSLLGKPRPLPRSKFKALEKPK